VSRVRTRQDQPHFLPATGPVGAGGDQGRDFETFRTYVGGTSNDGSPSRQLVGVCSLQTSGLATKIKNDLFKVAAGARVDVVYFFCEADIDVSTRHGLIGFARDQYNLDLEIFDGTALAMQLAAPELFSATARILGLPYDLLRRAGMEEPEAHTWAKRIFPDHPRPELYRYLQAVGRAAQENPRAFRFRLSPVPAPSLASAYVSQYLVDVTEWDNGRRTVPVEARTTWSDLLDRHKHLLVCGPAGMGKSSLLWHIAGSLADQWLAGHPAPYLPVRVHARHLVKDRPIAEAIHDAAIRSLGSKLTRTLPQSLFEDTPQPDVTWLVLIDGVDEIQDMASRDKALSTIVDMLGGSLWRLVIATRPLPASDLAALRRLTGEATLLPFDTDDIDRFAGHWLRQLPMQRRDSAIERLQRHARLEGLGNTPLVMALLCAMLVDDPTASLPDSRAILYEEVIKLLQRPPIAGEDQNVLWLRARSLDMLEELAFQRQCGDWETPLLDMALTWADKHDLQPSRNLSAQWKRLVHDVLCDTGLVAPDGADLAFGHHAIQEHLVARHLVSHMHDPGSDLLFDLLGSGAFPTDELANYLENSGLLGTLVELWTATGRDPDILITEVIEITPAACRGVYRLIADGAPVGESTAAALIKIVADQYTDHPERIAAAKALNTLGRPEGAAVLLAVSLDLDVEESDRLDVTGVLAHADPPVAAAIMWLTFTAYWDSYDYGYKMKAIPLVTGLGLNDTAIAAGLEIIITNPRLPDTYRAQAGARLINEKGKPAYVLLKAHMTPLALLFAAIDLAERGEPAGYILLNHLANDTTVASSDRLLAAESLSLLDE
jgi:hypothetical protein